ncbi:hypothetical protein [Actinoplanes sp. NPDC049316]|uniref:helix-turn-helix transcriptional regulator n=1 Tax=Actinoplanes sp. NPDC049316 TaxID=3154727 RepID=UPI00341BB259
MRHPKLRLMGAHEIRVRLGFLSRQRVYQITSRKDFPRPAAELDQGKVWRGEEVEAWIAVHRPQDLNDEAREGLREQQPARRSSAAAATEASN